MASTDATTFVVWPDSRSSSFDLPNEDTYLGTIVHAAAETSRSGIQAGSALLGAAIALVLTGLALFVVSRRRRVAQPTAKT